MPDSRVCRAGYPQPWRARGRCATSEPTLRTAESTVVWSRPPKARPISGRLWPVSSRARYMATLRARATCGRRSRARSASAVTPNCVGRGVHDVRDGAGRIGRGRAQALEEPARQVGRGGPRRAARRRPRPGSARPRARGRCCRRAAAISSSSSGRRRARRAARASRGSPAARGGRGRRARRRGRSAKRSPSRSSRPSSSSGVRSLVITSWRPDSWSTLKVWKSSSSVRALSARNWTSSSSSTSTPRKRSLNSLVSRRADGARRTRVVNSSTVA